MHAAIKLSPEEVQDIILQHFAAKTKAEVKLITPKLIDISGYGEDYQFDGFEVEVELD